MRSLMAGQLEVRVLQDAGHFANLCTGWLPLDPFSTNVIGVQLGDVLGGVRRQGVEDIWIVALDGTRVVGVAMHTPPYHLFLPRLPPGVASQIALILVTIGRVVDGVNGEASAVAEFVRAWSDRTGGSSSLVTAQRMYRLARLVAPASTPGRAQLAGADERDLLIDWLTRFHAEATPGRAGEGMASMVDRRLGASQLWLWWDRDVPMSVAGHSVPASGVARVGPVYTPPGHRRCGYGAAVTAAVTDAALRSGAEHVVLYTDLANPTSNSIYQAIGYVADHQAEDHKLLTNEGSPG